MLLRFQINGDEIALHIETYGENQRVRLPDGSEYLLTAERLSGDTLQITEQQTGTESDALPTFRMFRVPFARSESGLSFSYSGRTFTFEPVSDRRQSRKTQIGSGSILAPMVGVVADVLVTEGQPVEAYQPLLAIEAMKVIATLDAPFTGTVQKLHVQKGQRVEHGALLAEVVPAKTPAGEGNA